jgi:hypothetical protein
LSYFRFRFRFVLFIFYTSFPSSHAQILDAEDVINHPDELSIMTYVAYYRAYQNMNTAFAPNCTAEGPGLYKARQFEPGCFTVTCRSEENEEATRGGANVRCRLLDDKGKDVCNVMVKDLGTGKYDCQYIAPVPGMHTSDALLFAFLILVSLVLSRAMLCLLFLF